MIEIQSTNWEKAQACMKKENEFEKIKINTKREEKQNLEHTQIKQYILVGYDVWREFDLTFHHHCC